MLLNVATDIAEPDAQEDTEEVKEATVATKVKKFVEKFPQQATCLQTAEVKYSKKNTNDYDNTAEASEHP